MARNTWKTTGIAALLVLVIRSLGQPTFVDAAAQVTAQAAVQARDTPASHYTGSLACKQCHAGIYDRWHKNDRQPGIGDRTGMTRCPAGP